MQKNEICSDGQLYESSNIFSFKWLETMSNRLYRSAKETQFKKINWESKNSNWSLSDKLELSQKAGIWTPHIFFIIKWKLSTHLYVFNHHFSNMRKKGEPLRIYVVQKADQSNWWTSSLCDFFPHTKTFYLMLLFLSVSCLSWTNHVLKCDMTLKNGISFHKTTTHLL